MREDRPAFAILRISVGVGDGCRIKARDILKRCGAQENRTERIKSGSTGGAGERRPDNPIIIRPQSKRNILANVFIGVIATDKPVQRTAEQIALNPYFVSHGFNGRAVVRHVEQIEIREIIVIGLGGIIFPIGTDVDQVGVVAE